MRLPFFYVLHRPAAEWRNTHLARRKPNNFNFDGYFFDFA